MRVYEGNTGQTVGVRARKEAIYRIIEINDVLVVECVLLKEPQGAVAMLKVAPCHRFTAYWIRSVRQVVKNGRSKRRPDWTGIVKLPEAACIEIWSAGEFIKTIGESWSRVAREPAMSNGKVARQGIID